MRYQTHAVRICHKRVTGDSCFFLVCFGEASVDDQQLAATLDGRLAFLKFHGNMTVDDV